MSDHEQRQELRDTFRQITLTLAGVLAVYEADDELVWALAQALEQIVEVKLAPIEVARDVEDDPGPPRRRPHPAVVELLARIDLLEPEPGAKAAAR